MAGGCPACTVHFNIAWLLSRQLHKSPLTISQRLHNWPSKIKILFEGNSGLDSCHLVTNIFLSSNSSHLKSLKGSTHRPEKVQFEFSSGGRRCLKIRNLLTCSGAFRPTRIFPGQTEIALCRRRRLYHSRAKCDDLLFCHILSVDCHHLYFDLNINCDSNQYSNLLLQTFFCWIVKTDYIPTAH